MRLLGGAMILALALVCLPTATSLEARLLRVDAWRASMRHQVWVSEHSGWQRVISMNEARFAEGVLPERDLMQARLEGGLLEASSVVAVRNGVPILIENLAEVREGPAFKRGDGSFQTRPAVVATIQKSHEANTLELTRGDLGTTFRPGTRFGPTALRQVAGGNFPPQGDDKWPGYYDYEEGERYLKGVSRADVGDVNIMPADFMPNFDRITEAIKKIRARGALPVVLGGDHSITFPVLRGYEGIEEKIHIHFDSHLDFSDGGGFVRFAHGNPLRRSIEARKKTFAARVKSARSSPWRAAA